MKMLQMTSTGHGQFLCCKVRGHSDCYSKFSYCDFLGYDTMQSYHPLEEKLLGYDTTYSYWPLKEKLLGYGTMQSDSTTKEQLLSYDTMQYAWEEKLLDYDTTSLTILWRNNLQVMTPCSMTVFCRNKLPQTRRQYAACKHWHPRTNYSVTLQYDCSINCHHCENLKTDSCEC